MQKISFLLLKALKNNTSAQLCLCVCVGVCEPVCVCLSVRKWNEESLFVFLFFFCPFSKLFFTCPTIKDSETLVLEPFRVGSSALAH